MGCLRVVYKEYLARRTIPTNHEQKIEYLLDEPM